MLFFSAYVHCCVGIGVASDYALCIDIEEEVRLG